MQDPAAQDRPESQEQQGWDRARLDTILRTYTAREVEVAREALRRSSGNLGEAALRTLRVLGEEQKIDLRTAGDLVLAVAEADRLGVTMLEPVTEKERARRMAAIQGEDLSAVAPTRRVLGRGLAEIEQAARQFGTIEGTPTGFESVPPLFRSAPQSATDARIAEDVFAQRERDKRDLFAFRYGAVIPPVSLQTKNTPPMGPDEVIYIEGDPISRQRLDESIAKSIKATQAFPDAARVVASLPRFLVTHTDETGQPYGIEVSRPKPKRDSVLDGVTQRAVDNFLGTGTHRTTALRGFLRFLTQEDLATVLAECCASIDGEHLQHVMRMLGPDDLREVAWATQEEVSGRMSGSVAGSARINEDEAFSCSHVGYPLGEPPGLRCALVQGHEGAHEFDMGGERYQEGPILANRERLFGEKQAEADIEALRQSLIEREMVVVGGEEREEKRCTGYEQAPETGMVRQCTLPAGHEGRHEHHACSFSGPDPLPELPLRGFPIRPLAPHEHREPVAWSEDGNPLLEKDVELAVGILERAVQPSALAGVGAYKDERELADALEARTGWNSIYAGEVATEAWSRYYAEKDGAQ